MYVGSTKKSIRILPFVTKYRPSVLNLNYILIGKWHLIQNQPLLLKEMHKDPPLPSYTAEKGDL